MSKILVVVDMQKEFIKQCSAENIIGNVVSKIKTRKEEGYKIFLTVDRSGGELDERVSDACKGEKRYKKHSYGCKELILDLFDQNPDTVEFIGICTDMCVIANVLGTMAFLPFASIAVDSRCCAAAGDGHAAALRVMKSCNITVVS